MAENLDVLIDDPSNRPVLVTGNLEFKDITEKICSIPERKETPKGWWLGFLTALGLLQVLGISIAYLLWEGVGIWGVQNPVGWGFAIINFVWWVGIAHAGTLISAILFLLRQKWRTGINRFAEAMTIFAVACAGTFPGIHVGRAWSAYWMFPLPNQMGMWPNFRSPLLWDVFAVSTYATVSLLFWYMGLIPDFASIRDRAKNKYRKIAYGILSFGWRGANRHWQSYERAYLILAALATPLVLSVHTIVSFDFAVSILPGWHTTIFPPYFVAGAVFSGFAMVMTLMSITRKIYGLEDIVTMRHLENINKIILLTGSMVGYGYIMELFMAWYSGVPEEFYTFFVNRLYSPSYIIMFSCNVFVPQLFWIKKIRQSLPAMFIISILVNIGMWFERYVIVVSSLKKDFLPSSWDEFEPTFWDFSTYLGSIGLFFTLFFLFLRFFPIVAISEVKGVMPQADPHAGDKH